MAKKEKKLDGLIPDKFPQATQVLGPPTGQTEEDCLPLYVHQDMEAQTISCWRFTFWQALKILWRRKLWLGILAGGRTQPPVWLSLDDPFQWAVPEREQALAQKDEVTNLKMVKR